MSKSHRENGIAIASWISAQRASYKLGELSKEHQRQLESLKGWGWEVFDESWELRFALALEFAKREGHANVPQRHKENGTDMGTWVNTQRSNYTKGTLGHERIVRLEQLPNWTWYPKQAAWTTNYSLLCDYVNENGHAKIPDELRYREVQLGKWVGKQRQKFKNGRLEAERISLLEKLPGWIWSAR